MAVPHYALEKDECMVDSCVVSVVAALAIRRHQVAKLYNLRTCSLMGILINIQLMSI